MANDSGDGVEVNDESKNLVRRFLIQVSGKEVIEEALKKDAARATTTTSVDDVVVEKRGVWQGVGCHGPVKVKSIHERSKAERLITSRAGQQQQTRKTPIAMRQKRSRDDDDEQSSSQDEGRSSMIK